MIIRKIEWHPAAFRPAYIPTVICPAVFDWDTHQRVSAAMGVNRCLGCDYAGKIDIDCETWTGSVHCSAPDTVSRP